MIKVERPATPPSLDFADASSPASRELQVILDYRDEHGELPKSPVFAVYANADVKALLIRIFHGKCAYCELLATAGFDGDVEHYRPKKGVTDADQAGVDHPGYWWLAMAWENLLLSCQHCNQSRRQLIHEPGLPEEEIERELREGRLRTTGKKNRFPVAGNIWITDRTPDMTGEEPLIINPLDTDPKNLFEWEFHRSISTVKARDGDPRANHTIEILGLNRRGLTEARVTVLNGLRRKRKTILERLERLGQEADQDVAEALLDTVMEDLADLKASGEAQSVFAGMTRAFIDQLEAEVAAMLA